MSEQKSYGQIAYDAANRSFKGDCWNEAAQAVIEEYKRRQPALVGSEIEYACKKAREKYPAVTRQWFCEVAAILNAERGFSKTETTPQLPSAEKIAEAIYSIYGDKWPNASDHDKSICMREAQAVLDLFQAKRVDIPQTREEELQADLDERRAKDVDSILKKLDNENQGESEEQYQSRLLRALRASR